MKKSVKQYREDLFVTALEGGSNYWIDNIKVGQGKGRMAEKKINEEEGLPEDTGQPFSMILSWLVQNGHEVVVVTEEDYEEYVLNKKKVVAGEKLMKQDFEERYVACTYEDGDFDAEDADVWFQLCVLGEVVFG